MFITIQDTKEGLVLMAGDFSIGVEQTQLLGKFVLLSDNQTTGKVASISFETGEQPTFLIEFLGGRKVVRKDQIAQTITLSAFMEKQGLS
ncbi:MAG: hypothetical protein HC892_00020 [Saprospiraceae bacterium]|nr:hypothetical protein [Saprospiraceae bacterium]